MNDVTQEIELLVRTRCRLADEPDQGETRPGAKLFAKLEGLGIEGVCVTPIECLSNCSRGCTIALRGPDRWTYVYGGLKPGEALGILAEGVGKYRAAPDGLVSWRERPEHFRKNCIARIPPMAKRAQAPNLNAGKP